MNSTIADEGIDATGHDPYLALPLEGIRLIEASAGAAHRPDPGGDLHRRRHPGIAQAYPRAAGAGRAPGRSGTGRGRGAGCALDARSAAAPSAG
ncbi:hypothetical protein G6F56_014469 [Rhizopus delemar]|nr:hypothetical protein G6F56_014469 [Rhizopus delemar]